MFGAYAAGMSPRVRWWGVAGVAALVVVLVGAVVALRARDDEGGGDEATPSPGWHSVVYELTGRGGAKRVIYSADPDGASLPEVDVELPWRTEFVIEEPWFSFVLLAESGDGGDSVLRCRITLDGKEISHSEVSGARQPLTCGGSSVEVEG
jgi:hypothetical protein